MEPKQTESPMDGQPVTGKKIYRTPTIAIYGGLADVTQTNTKGPSSDSKGWET